MDLRQFKYFVAIVDYASLSKAANHLYVAQPALSQHVRHMEEELQVTLLHRTSRGVEPTDEGKRLYLHAKKLLTLAAETQDAVRDTVIDPIGEVRVGMPGTISDILSVPLVLAAAERYAQVRVCPVEAMSNHILEWLHRGDVDLALVDASADAKGLQIQGLLSEELVLFGKPGMCAAAPEPGAVISLRHLFSLDLVVPGLSNGLRMLIEETAMAARTRVVARHEIDSYRQIKTLAMAGAGYGILPITAVMAEVAQDLLHCWRIEPPGLHWRINLVHSRERPLTTAGRVIMQLALETSRDLVRKQVWRAELAPEAGEQDRSTLKL